MNTDWWLTTAGNITYELEWQPTTATTSSTNVTFTDCYWSHAMTSTRQMSFTSVKTEIHDQMHWKDKLTFTGAYSFQGGVHNQTIPLPLWAQNPHAAKYMIVCADQSSGPHLCPANYKVTASYGRANLCWDHWHDLVPAIRCSHDHNGDDDIPTFAPWELNVCASCAKVLCETHTEEHSETGAPLCGACAISAKICTADGCGAFTFNYCETCDTPICDEHIIESEDPDDEDHAKSECATCATSFNLSHSAWEGISVTPVSTSWNTRWGLRETRHLSPTTAAADYYLLLALRDDLLLSRRGANGYRELAFLRIEAASMLKALVEVFDPVFCRYSDMIVGGELRHAGTLGLPHNRSVAWSFWYDIREALGLRALEIAAERFISEFVERTSYGGAPWAAIARTLHARLSGRITPELFLDRVFNLQHHGGCMLNKVVWAGDLSYITHYIGPAHSADPPDWSSLLALASGHVWDLWRFYRDTARAIQMDRREPVDLLPRPPTDHYTRSKTQLVEMTNQPYSDYVRTMT
jgi:hypothetical protein